MVRNGSCKREVRGSRLMALLLALALAVVGSSALALPVAAAADEAGEVTVEAEAKAQATLMVIGLDAEGDPTYFLAPETLDITDGENGWDFVKSAFDEAGITYEVQDSQYGAYLVSITDPVTGTVYANEPSAPYTSWILYVNGEASSTGISGVTLKSGDTVTWYYAAYNDDYSAPAVPALPVAMYRLYNPWTGEHLYTESTPESADLLQLGWKAEGTGWNAAQNSSTPIYRLYNHYNSEHLYTTDKAEYDYLVSLGWSGEGVKGFSDDAKGVAVYRLFNPYAQVGTHLYTTDKAEYDYLETLGWKGEDEALYGVK